jgi:hypothetical protein
VSPVRADRPRLRQERRPAPPTARPTPSS